jgi:hypothetical protein
MLGVEYVVYHPRSAGVPERRRAAERFERLIPGLEGTQVELAARFDESPSSLDDPDGVLGGERVYRILPREAARRRRPRFADRAPLSRQGWSCTSRPAGGCERALDGRLTTAFETQAPQADLDFLRVVFSTPTRVSGVALASGVRSQFYPTRLQLSGLIDGEWRRLPHRTNRLEFLQDLLSDPRTAALELPLRQPAVVGGLEVLLLPSHRRFNPWHVLELRAYP